MRSSRNGDTYQSVIATHESKHWRAQVTGHSDYWGRQPVDKRGHFVRKNVTGQRNSSIVQSGNVRDHPVRGVILTLKTHVIANLGASLCSSGELRAELGVYPISVRSCKLFLGSSTPSHRSALTSTRSGRKPPYLRCIVAAERCRSSTRASFAIYFSKSVGCINVDFAAREIE